MDTTSHLALVSNDCLRRILYYTRGEAIGKLVLCGNRFLGLKLRSSNVVDEIRYDHPAFVRISGTMPMIQQFKGLKCLRIVLNENEGVLPLIGSDWLGELPKSIEEIAFGFHEAHECWMRPGARQNNDFFIRPNYPLFDFGTHFPKLNKLWLASRFQVHMDARTGQMDHTNLYGIFEAKDISSLPVSLTSLSLPTLLKNRLRNNANDQRIDCFSHLTNLVELALPKGDTDSVISDGLVSLEKLVCGASSLPNQEFWASHGPSSLTYLDISTPNIYDAKHVPKLKFLPRTLLTLLTNFIVLLPADTMAGLPRSLTKLRINLSENFHDRGVTQLPPNLTFLHLNQYISAPGQCYFGLLPRSLTKLIDGPWCQPEPEDWLKLPSSITKLRFRRRNYIGVQHIKYVPSHVKHLILHRDDTYDIRYPDETRKNIVLPGTLSTFCEIPDGHQIWAHKDDSLEYLLRLKPTFASEAEKLEIESALAKKSWVELDEALGWGNIPILEWFFSKFSRSFSGELIHACLVPVAKNNMKVVQWMYENDYLPANLQKNIIETTSLLTIEAASHGHLKMLDWLHRHGARVTYYDLPDTIQSYPKKKDEEDEDDDDDDNYYSNKSEGILERAIQNGHLEIVKWAHLHGFYLDKKLIDHQTPLALARQYKRQNIVDWLIELGLTS